MARKQVTATKNAVGVGTGGRGSGEGHGGDADNHNGNADGKAGLFRAKSMPKKRTHAFHFPLQVVSPRRETMEGGQEERRGRDGEAVKIDAGLESPTLPPPVAFTPMPRGSFATSEGTSGRGSKRLTM